MLVHRLSVYPKIEYFSSRDLCPIRGFWDTGYLDTIMDIEIISNRISIWKILSCCNCDKWDTVYFAGEDPRFFKQGWVVPLGLQKQWNMFTENCSTATKEKLQQTNFPESFP